MIKKIRDFLKPKQPVRLNKEVNWQEKVQNWINAHYGLLFVVGFFVAIFLFAILLMCFFPGSESGLVYNNRTGGVI